MIFSKEESAKIIEKVISFSKADSVEVNLSGGTSMNLRFAVNTVSTSGAADTLDINITSNIGKKSGSVSLTSIDDSEIERAVRKSEEIAGYSPENEEFIAPPGQQSNYLEVKEFFEDTEKINPSDISEKISYTLKKAEDKKLISSGYFEKNAEFVSNGNSNGLFSYHKSTSSKFSSTMRTEDSTGSGKIDRMYADINLLNIKKFSDNVAERAILSKGPVKCEAGKYVTILDNAAVCDMLNNLLGYLNKRSADEGRSYFSDKDKGNKIGQQIADVKVDIFSDPQFADAPSTPFTREGVPLNKTEWISKGILKNLFSNRYWAEKTKTKYIPYPSNIIMKGTDKSVEDLIASTEKGIYVSRFWYIRQVDPRQILLTGLTRDGVFLIENGKIKSSVNNFRFNESPLNVLKHVIDLSVSEKVVGSETYDSKIVVPALKLSEFNFSSVSDAI